jgi:hypothetical protein
MPEMIDRFDTTHTMSDLEYFFPIPSQTSSRQTFLLGTMRLVRNSRAYNYLEIGSFLGGSLTPFLMDTACKTILSIDDRGINYDYTIYVAINARRATPQQHKHGQAADL